MLRDVNETQLPPAQHKLKSYISVLKSSHKGLDTQLPIWYAFPSDNR
jgi:hypothetical protein